MGAGMNEVKLVSFTLFILLLSGLTVSEVEVGQGFVTEQDDGFINVSDNFSVDRVRVYNGTTDFDKSNFSLNPSTGAVDVQLSWYNPGAPVGRYVANFTSNVSSENNVNFTYTGLDTGFYFARQNGSRLRNERSDSFFYWFNASNWDLRYRQNFTVLHVNDTGKPFTSSFNFTPENPVYTPAEPVNVTIDASIGDNNTGLNKSFIATNESRSWRNYTDTYGGVKRFSGELTADVQYYWDNRRELFQRGGVHIAVWTQDRAGNWHRSSEKAVKVDESPVLVDVETKDVQQYEVATLKAWAVDPVGYGDIVNVTFNVESPSGEEFTVTGVRGQRIVETVDGNNYTGNIYVANFSETQEAGNYIVNATVYDEQRSDSFRDLLQVGGAVRILRRLFLDPFHLGQSYILEAVVVAVSRNKEYVFMAFAPILIIVATIIYTNTGLNPKFFESKNVGGRLNPAPDRREEQ